MLALLIFLNFSKLKKLKKHPVTFSIFLKKIIIFGNIYLAFIEFITF